MLPQNALPPHGILRHPVLPTRRSRRYAYVGAFRSVPLRGTWSRLRTRRSRSITTSSQHVRPALRAARPRFAALLSSCAQGSALPIPSVSLCQYERCALFLPQLATGDTFLHTRLGAGPSRLARVCGRSVFPPSRYAGVRALHALPSQLATRDTFLHTRLGAGCYIPESMSISRSRSSFP